MNYWFLGREKAVFSLSCSAALIVFLITLLRLYFAPSLNADAVLYLYCADIFREFGWGAAEAVYRRPFYPAVIGVVADFLSVSSLASAVLVTAFLSGATAYAFVSLVVALGGSVLCQRLAVLVIICFPGFANYQDYLIRDFGYWSGLMLAAAALVRYMGRQRVIDLVSWGVFTGLAALFRPEAIILGILMPIGILLCRDLTAAARLRAILYCYVMPFLSASLLFLWFLDSIAISGVYQYMLQEPIEVIAGLFDSWLSLTSVVRDSILNRYSEQYAGLFLISGLAGIYISQLLDGLGVWAILCMATLFYRGAWVRVKNGVFLVALISSLMMLAIFLIEKQFLQARFTIFSCFLLLITLCFSLANAIEKQRVTSKWRSLLLLIAVCAFIDGQYSFGYSKKYISDAVDWLARYAEPQSSVISNNPQISYRSGLGFNFEDHRRLGRQSKIGTAVLPLGYDFVVWVNKRGGEAPMFFKQSDIDYCAVADFENERGDRAIIYEIVTDVLKHGRRCVNRVVLGRPESG